jgi:hypothetical protein
MNEQCQAVLGKDEIGFSGEILAMQAKPQPECVSGLSYPHFGRRVFAPNLRHQP